MIRKFLGDEDWSEPIDHWANYTGKSMYRMARVELAEILDSFIEGFIATSNRRKLSDEFVATVVGRCVDLRAKRDEHNARTSPSSSGTFEDAFAKLFSVRYPMQPDFQYPVVKAETEPPPPKPPGPETMRYPNPHRNGYKYPEPGDEDYEE